jgi:DNA repair exonuclease SbcCD ATPase subunit
MSYRSIEERFYRAASDVVSLFKDREVQHDIDVNCFRERIEERDQRIDELEERLGDKTREISNLKKDISRSDDSELQQLKKIVEEQKNTIEEQKKTVEKQKKALEEQKRDLEDQKRTLEEHKKLLREKDVDLRCATEAAATYKRLVDIANQSYHCSPIPPFSIPHMSPNITQPEVSYF